MRAIDSHVHFWKVSDHDWYPALAPFAEAVGSETINVDFLPDDYRRDAVGLDVRAFVHVSATTAPGTYLQEAQWIDALADEYGLDLVMIGTIDPDSDADQIRADLDQQARSARFAGARVFPGIAPDSAAAGVLIDWLDANGKVFDLVTDPSSASAWAEQLEEYPNLKVAIEHTGSPAPSEDDAFETWRIAMQRLAERPGTMVKVTGLGMVTGTLDAETLRPWITTVIDIFGWDRVMFGSNVPIETMAGTYADWTASLSEILADATAEDRARFYEHNARFYWS